MFRKAIIFPLSLSIFFLCAAVAAAFQLPDTGQSKCYQTVSPYAEIPCAGTGQDGEYSINPMSYTDNLNGTVTDNNTGLTWQRQEGHTHNWYEATGTYDATYNATSYSVCGSLPLGGYTDWRLPSKKELITIIDYSISYPEPTINNTYFPNTSLSPYWTSTTPPIYTSFAWTVSFALEGVISDNKDHGHFIRCVRGGPYPSQSFMDNGNMTVTDNKTGLIWQQEQGKGDWDFALSYCKGLTLANQSDWRLPNIREIESLTDDTKANPSIDTVFFPNASFSYYWSSTTFATDPSKAEAVYNNYGSIGSYSKDDTWEFYVRCVRGGVSLGNLIIIFSGTGGGTVTGSGVRIGATASFSTGVGTTEQFDIGTIVNLHAAPSEYSLFTGWTGACSGASDCALPMTANRDVTGLFNFDTAHKTWIYGTSNYHPTFLSAYSDASAGNIIQAWGTGFSEDLVLGRNISITIKGGYNQGYTLNNGYTILQGSLTVCYGALVLERLVIR